MKNTLLQPIFSALCALIFLAGCEQPEETPPPAPKPVASFDFDAPDSTKRAVQFRNTSQNAQNYYWDFGDGQASTLDNPKHEYQQAGTYTVRLNAIGEGGTDKTAKTIAIFAFPYADFAFTSGGCVASCEVYFENRSINAHTFLWDFGDGKRSQDHNPTHLYTRGGDFTVRLTATGETGIAKFERTIHIQDSILAPVAEFTIQGGGCEAPCEVEFRNKSENATDFLWDFGNGIQSRVENPKYTYTEAGVYTIRLLARGEGGTDQIVRTLNIREKN